MSMNFTIIEKKMQKTTFQKKSPKPGIEPGPPGS